MHVRAVSPQSSCQPDGLDILQETAHGTPGLELELDSTLISQVTGNVRALSIHDYSIL